VHFAGPGVSRRDEGGANVKNWLAVSIVIAGLAWGIPAAAQDRSDDEDEGGEPRLALGVGLGLVEPSDDVEPYLNASLRIRIGGGGGDRDDRGGRESRDRRRSDDWRGRRNDDQGIRGYLEPEIGYWEANSDNDGDPEGSDLLVGLNLVGVVPLGSVDSFFGVGAGAHFIDAQLVDATDIDGDSQTKLGLNAQFGLDIYLTRSLSLFGVGRFDLVEDTDDSVQSKVYIGLRGRF
jgi:hypothetical protein